MAENELEGLFGLRVCNLILPKEILEYVDRQAQLQIVPREVILMRFFYKGMGEFKRERHHS